jgi:hypothetical protein
VNSVDTETLAEGFAAEGREELIVRFREAYAKALGTHSDLVSFDSERIEAMVQRSAAEADGLQWRRALAGVAARELGIDLGSALTHPAVVRAHQLAGAPSYETALAALALPAPVPEPPSAPTPPTPPAVADTSTTSPMAPDPEPVDPEPAEIPELELPEPEPELAVVESAPEPEPALPEPAMPEPEPEPTPVPSLAGIDEPTMAYDTLGPEPGSVDEDGDGEASDDVLGHRADDFAAEFMAGEPVAATEPAAGADQFIFEADAIDGAAREADETEFGAVHLGGVASLPSSEEIALRLSEEGLDLLQDDGTIVGRLGWTDIAALEVTVPHGRRRRRNAPRLVVHTAGGSARFEVPTLSGEELQDRVQPLMARFGHLSDQLPRGSVDTG